MSDYKQLDEYIENLEKLLVFLRDYRKRQFEDSQTGDYLREFHHLKELLRSSAWPPAILPEFMCRPDSETDKHERAMTILAGLVPLAQLSFLDYGCGEGHVAWEASHAAKKVVGFDIEEQSWGHLVKDNLYFTTNFNDVRQHGPYDIILLYDVLDHCDDPVATLKQVKEVRRGNGPIYAHCHPWASRHATHLYHTVNKAFLHLVFSDKELLKLGFKGIKTAKLLNSMETYRKWFKDAGLQVKMEVPHRKTIEDFFFHDPLISRRLKAHWPGNLPHNEVNLESVDYIVA